jgi:hypothetical protein
MHWRDEGAFEADLRTALALTTDEHAYLAGLDLAAAWRTAPADLARRVTWLSATFIAAVSGTWLLTLPLLGSFLELPNRFGASIVLLRLLLNVLWTGVETLLVLAASPALGLALPILALLGLAVLAWPRPLISSRI